jgi:CSLREA domain-containing protein
MKTTLAVMLLLLPFVGSAPADTFVVNNVFDPGNGTCDAAGCTLREAIDAANANPGADIINFNIPGANVQTISPASELPTIIEAVTIDGYTQPGAAENTLAVGNDAVLLIELDGSSAGLVPIGLNISTAGGNVIRGLVINRWLTAININSDGNLIEGNFIGTDADGTGDLGNTFRGVSVTNGDNNVVGGPLPGARNLISGNGSSGVVVFCCGDNSNLIQGNYIGTDRNGTAALPNDEDGVTISGDSHSNTVGGTEPGEGNLISVSMGT